MLPLLIILAGSINAQEYLSIEDALVIGLEKNAGIIVARGNAEIAERQEGLGTAGFLPALDLSGNAAKTNSEVDTNSPFSFGNQERTSYNGQASINWILFDGLFMFYNNQKYGRLSDQGQWRLRQSVENESVGIINAYYDLVRKSVQLKIAEEGQNISRLRMEQEAVRKDLGGASSTDYLSAMVTYNNDRLNVLRSQNNVEIARRQLNIVLGRDPNTSVAVDTLIPVKVMQFDPDSLVQLAMKSNSSIIIQGYQSEISGLDVGNAWSGFMPRIAANGSYSYAEAETETESPDPARQFIKQEQIDKQIGLNMSWNLFNGNRDYINVQAAKINERNQEVLLADTRRRIVASIRNQTATYRNSIEAWEIASDNSEISATNLALFEERYRLGSATFVEYRVALLDYLTAQSNYIDAAFTAKTAEAELKRLSGILIKEVM